MVQNEFLLSGLSSHYPNALPQGIWPFACLMKNKDQFYLCGADSGNSWKRTADIGSALKVLGKAILLLCNFLFFLLWVGVEENAERLTLCPF